MKTNILFIFSISVLLLSCSQVTEKAQESEVINYTTLKSNFQNPSSESGVNCWWWWLNSNVNKAAITKDLEAMKSRNFQGAMIFDAGGHNQRGNKDIPAGPLFGSDEWNELFVFAMDEAKNTFTCSPPEMGLPGQEYFAGTYVNPHVTWWNQSGALIDYIHRTQSVVQEGKFVADVLYYYGDHVPNVFPFKHADPAGVMPGFDYDVCDETIFLQMKVEDGKIVVPGGVKYRILVLPDHKVLSLAVLEKVEKLLQQGAKVIGYKPESTISLVGGEKAEHLFMELATKIWGDEVTVTGEKKVGKGAVIWGMPAREYLLSKDISVDFDILENDSKTDFDYIHYTIGESIVLFNTEISENKQGTEQINYADFETLAEITGEWEVDFDPKWGGPESVLFPELMDWTLHTNEGIKFYSGTAVYNKTFNIGFEIQTDKQYFLQLENVKDVGIAEVKINGKDKGILWTKPFRAEISNELQKGENTLEIKVVNSWYNRVAGDQTFPGKKQYTSSNIDLKHDFRGRPIDEIPLEPSGLMGPVTIEVAVLEG